MAVIFHLDFDAFFVSAHRTINPALIGVPVAVAKDGRRSVVTAASYEAKALGIKVPMPLYRAKVVSPHLRIVTPDFRLYGTLSSQAFSYLAKHFTELIEVASIDECYMDVSAMVNSVESALALAKKMQTDLWSVFKLPCSIGISHNKFVAKMTTSLAKPNGVRFVSPSEFLSVFGAQDISTFYGVGKALAPRLHGANYHTISDLANAKADALKSILGSLASNYIAHANGQGAEALTLEEADPQSFSHEVTFQDNDKNERSELLTILRHLASALVKRLENNACYARVVRVSLKYAQRGRTQRITKQSVLLQASNDLETLLAMSVRIFDAFWDGRALKFIGLGFASLVPIGTNLIQISLFEKSPVPGGSKREVLALINRVNAELSGANVMTSRTLLKQVNKHKANGKNFSNAGIES